jgi:hypothetical protein
MLARHDASENFNRTLDWWLFEPIFFFLISFFLYLIFFSFVIIFWLFMYACLLSIERKNRRFMRSIINYNTRIGTKVQTKRKLRATSVAIQNSTRIWTWSPWVSWSQFSPGHVAPHALPQWTKKKKGKRSRTRLSSGIEISLSASCSKLCTGHCFSVLIFAYKYFSLWIFFIFPFILFFRVTLFPCYIVVEPLSHISQQLYKARNLRKNCTNSQRFTSEIL